MGNRSHTLWDAVRLAALQGGSQSRNKVEHKESAISDSVVDKEIDIEFVPKRDLSMPGPKPKNENKNRRADHSRVVCRIGNPQGETGAQSDSVRG